ncbi:MAG: HlyD family efflux transporter periplasmic adaptor subunit [Lachnospiraceae bacterium]|nr:HlyD family efflux transporter periplasmic adaptor subunit [Lachnospiraceae bacterium]
MSRKKKGMGKWVVGGLVVAAGVAYFGFGEQLGIRKEGGETMNRQQQMMQASTSEAQVLRGDIQVVTEGSGSIEAADKQAIYADFPLLVSEVIGENGDLVSQGEVIARLDAQSVKDQLRASRQQLSSLDETIRTAPQSGSESLTAPVKGRVKRIFCEKGDLLADVTVENGGIMEIAADGKLEVTVPVDTGAGLSLHTGQDILVRIDGEEEEGYISALENGECTAVFEDRAEYDVDDEATVTTAEGRIIGSGRMVSHYPYLVQAEYGTVKEVKVEENDYVEVGSTLLTRKFTTYTNGYEDLLAQRSELLEDLTLLRGLDKEPVILAQESGILCELALTEGVSTVPNGQMYSVISTDSYHLKAQIDELDIAGVEEGQKAVIVFDALDEEEFEGKVTKVSRLGTNVGGVTSFTVTLEMAGDDRIKTSMSATAKIVTAHKEDTLTIPVDAVQTEDGTKFVNVVTAEGTQRRNVTLGLVNNATAEVLEGLSEGETVVVIGTSELEDMMNMMNAGMQAGQEKRAGGAE